MLAIHELYNICYRGLRVISKFRRERMEAIAHEINAYDVAALQEVCQGSPMDTQN